ncbi:MULTISPECIES: HD domain-containing protein [unclassified Granulicatella]|uniref:HD domain-containing protein n=1 Tax=unclassified Granulicatella TaxID=2630493 RepID=UPI00107333D6|nr:MULTISPECIES: HD domain-containing protein [unclassified Granulicatella]MBF0780999.1 HD domain-containing protein [Granulicatella sp. 19428wC4_WM01]TFU92715.1 HD domain-containing protein [Granulicatella sp. WM01]
MTYLLTREKVFRDPVHGYIHVQHQTILDLINTREFQRLRRIKQLGTSSSIFHGAEHSRFSHSLGVYEIARRICDKFQRTYSTQEEGDGLWNDNERLVTLCAALLHDVGHGPFSHTFEKVFGTDHEALTIQIILSKHTQIHDVLKRVAPDFPEKVASVIQKKYDNPQVVQMISSQIDADRMDYLLRDAYFAAVSYGTFDLNRILRVIKPYKDGICFDYSGMHAVEDYIVSRYQMYMQVYFHPVSRAVEMLIHHLFERANYCYEEKHLQHRLEVPLLVPFFEKNWTLEDYLRLDDGVMTTYFTVFSQEQDAILQDLATRYLTRRLFKSVVIQHEEDAEALIAYSHSKGYDKTYYTGFNNSYDLPYDFYRPNQAKARTSIQLMNKDGSLVELSQTSMLVEALTGREKGDKRFYFAKELLQDAEFVNLLNSVESRV